MVRTQNELFESGPCRPPRVDFAWQVTQRKLSGAFHDSRALRRVKLPSPMPARARRVFRVQRPGRTRPLLREYSGQCSFFFRQSNIGPEAGADPNAVRDPVVRSIECGELSMTMHEVEKPSPAQADEAESSEVELSDIKPLKVPFERLVHDHLGFVWRTLRRFGVSAAEVDDAAQRVFLIANDKLDSIRPGSERSFLVAVAVRVASHWRRANQRRQAVHERWFQTEPPPPAAEEPARRAEARELLDRVLDQMPENLRSVFVLFEFEELTVSEVAVLLELPRGTVATRLRRARTVFREQARALEQTNKGSDS